MDAQEPVTLHKSTAAQEHRLLGKLHSLEGKINKATGMVRGGRGRVFRVAKGQNLDLVPIEVSTPAVFAASCAYARTRACAVVAAATTDRADVIRAPGRTISTRSAAAASSGRT